MFDDRTCRFDPTKSSSIKYIKHGQFLLQYADNTALKGYEANDGRYRDPARFPGHFLRHFFKRSRAVWRLLHLYQVWWNHRVQQSGFPARERHPWLRLAAVPAGRNAGDAVAPAAAAAALCPD